ncbi:hypothetical protein [Oribacterium sp. P6A1]|uniref:hypothetical protein n=1 Tax=Oribacterium sp. P6A1 TaxID=1410612 RepID=UPI000568B864|nr:hypothetical protein [Oribacterium sp. P6A1]
MAGNINNISKKKALDYLNEKLKEKSIKEITDFMYEIVFWGKDISMENNDIFYYCRAYNIISYGVEHNVTNVMHDYVEEHESRIIYRAYSKVISRFPKGIPNDTPLFSELLDTQLKIEVAEAEAEEEKAHSSFLGKLNKLFKK